MSDDVIRIDLYGWCHQDRSMLMMPSEKGSYKMILSRPYIHKIFAYETIAVLVLQNCPIRTKYICIILIQNAIGLFFPVRVQISCSKVLLP